MTLFYYYGSSDFGNDRIRLGPSGFSFTEAADAGTLAMSRIQVDDPAGALDIVGHHAFRAIETACSWDSLFRGYFADRVVKRGESLLTAAARVWDCTVYDLNAALSFEVIRGSDGYRPKETDTERLAWALGSGYTGPVSTDDGAVFGADVDLDKADYRGRYLADVVNDCAQVSGCNFFVAWDDTVGAPVLHYYLPTRAFNSSTLKISNVLGDVDGLTVYAPDAQAGLARDPSRVYSGLYYQYGERTSAAYRTSASVLSDIGHKREATEQDPSVRTAARAQAKADKWLDEADTELDTISVVLHQVPPSAVNLIRAGQRIQVKFTHLPGFTSYTWMRVVRRTVEQDGDTQLLYALGLELANPKMGGTKRGPRNAVPVDMEDGSSVGIDRYCLQTRRYQIWYDSGQKNVPIPDEVNYDAAPPGHSECTEETPFLRRPYTMASCPPTFQGGHSGTLREEQWFECDPGDLVGVASLRFTYTTTDERFTTGRMLEYGVLAAADGPPDTDFDYEVLGTCDPGGGTFDIPASVLTPSVTNYVVLAPRDLSIRGVETCDDALAQPIHGGPLGDPPTYIGGGEYGSWQVDIASIAATTRVVSGSGTTPWTSMTGDIDGTNREFTLPDWNGSGIPQVRIGGVVYAAGQDYTWDAAAGTIEMNFAPWEGAPLQGRWKV